MTEPRIAVTVIGTNLVMDYGTKERAVAAMDALRLDEPWYSGAPLSAWSATVRDEVRDRTALLDRRLADLRRAALAVYHGRIGFENPRDPDILALGVVLFPDRAQRDERRVERMAAALHEDCLLEWQAVAVVDPTRQITMHAADAHYGRAHDLVRRIFGDAAAAGVHLGDEGLRERIEDLTVYRYILPTDDPSAENRSDRKPYDMLRRDEVLAALAAQENPEASR